MRPVITDPDHDYYKDRMLCAEPFDRVAFARDFEHRICHVDGMRMHYVVGGSGPVIVFGHGWPASWYEWRKVLPLLKDDFTVVAFDMPGHGDSGFPPAYDDATIAGIIETFVREELKADEIFLVGHDVSGGATVHLAARTQGLVKKLFVTETAIAGEELSAVFAAHMTETWHIPVNAARLPSTFATGREEHFIPQFFTDWVYNTGAITKEDIDEYVRCARRPGAIEAGTAYYHKTPSLTEDGEIHPAGSIDIPFKFVGAEFGFGGHLGGEDQSAYRTIAKFATNPEYEVLDRCSHWVSEDRPYTIAKKMREFFAG